MAKFNLKLFYFYVQENNHLQLAFQLRYHLQTYIQLNSFTTQRIMQENQYSCREKKILDQLQKNSNEIYIIYQLVIQLNSWHQSIQIQSPNMQLITTTIKIESTTQDKSKTRKKTHKPYLSKTATYKSNTRIKIYPKRAEIQRKFSR